MIRRPDSANLLRAARRTLLDAVAPALSGAARYNALMVANAMAIVLRDLDAGDNAEREELALFEALYGTETVDRAGAGDAARLDALGRRLAAEIRDGKWDDASPALMALLRARVRAKLARSNPNFLAASDGS